MIVDRPYVRSEYPFVLLGSPIFYVSWGEPEGPLTKTQITFANEVNKIRVPIVQIKDITKYNLGLICLTDHNFYNIHIDKSYILTWQSLSQPCSQLSKVVINVDSLFTFFDFFASAHTLNNWMHLARVHSFVIYSVTDADVRSGYLTSCLFANLITVW